MFVYFGGRAVKAALEERHRSRITKGLLVALAALAAILLVCLV